LSIGGRVSVWRRWLTACLEYRLTALPR